MFLRKFTLRRAASIQAKEELSRKIANEARLKEYEEDKAALNRGRRLLHEVVEARAKTMANIPCHIKKNDIAILNVYDLGFNGHNSWDGGPSVLINCIMEQQEIDTPVIVQITDVFVDRSLAYEKIDQFVERHISLNDLKNSDDLFIRLSYEKHVGTKNAKDYYLYKSAKFINGTKFQPQWGLNVKSFIPKDSPDFAKTYEIWRKEIELEWRSAELQRSLREVEERKLQVMNETRDHRNLFN